MILRSKLDMWTVLHSFICLSFGVLIYTVNGKAFYELFAIIIVTYGSVSFLFLFIQGKEVISLANFISLIRLVFGQIVILLMLLKLNLSYLKFSLLVCAGLSDMIDGFIARKKGATAFGAKLDMELDAFFMFILSIIGFLSYDIGGWILLIGLMRYGYVFILLLFPPMEDLPKFARLSAKAICGFSVFTLISINAPFFAERGKVILNKCSLFFLSFSFLLDFSIHLISQNRLSKQRNF